MQDMFGNVKRDGIMKNRMISVIIPAYNAEAYIEDCLQSVLSQENAEFEVIIVNDGSTDHTGSLCREWSRRYKNIVYIEQENQGQGSARNCGIRHAAGAWLVFLDADDELIPGALHKLQEMTKQEVDIVCYEFFLSRHSGQSDEHIALFDGKCQSNENLLRDSTSFLWDKMFRTEFWRQEAISLDNVYGEDFKTVYLLEALCRHFTFLREPLIRHYERENNLSSDPQKVMEISQAIEEMLKEFVRRNLFERYRISLFYIIKKQYSLYQTPDFCDFKPGQAEMICKKINCIMKKYFKECIVQYETFRDTELNLIGCQCRLFYKEFYEEMSMFKNIAHFPELEALVVNNIERNAKFQLYLVDLSQEGRNCRFGTRTTEWQERRWEGLVEEFFSIVRQKGEYARILLIDNTDVVNQGLFHKLKEQKGVYCIHKGTPLLKILSQKEISYVNPCQEKKADLISSYWCKGEQYRSQFNENILHAWLMLKNKNKNLSSFFLERGHQNIAIYGMGYLGERLLEELDVSDINVVYGVDRGCKEIEGFPVYTMEEDLPKADVIIVTVVHLFLGIKYELEKWTDIPIVSLEEVLETLLQDDQRREIC